MPVRDER
jgi:competence ComEA-like helix-hairpin-helix protein